MIRDLGRGMCAVEWAAYCGRSKCVEIIEKYMDKMQVNPGLPFDAFNPSGSDSSGGSSGSSRSTNGHQRFNSMQSLKRSSLPAAISNLNLNFNKVKQSWVIIIELFVCSK